MTRADLHALRTPLTALALTLLVAAGAILYSSTLLDDARRLLAQRETQLKEARLRIRKSDTEQDLITRYSGAYLDLTRTGFAGDERRIEWLEGLRHASKEARTFGIDYDIGAQRPYTYSAEFSPAPLQLNESLMRVRLRLLHEEDLPRFFDALGRTAHGFFTVDSCVMRRLPPGSAEQSNQVHQNIAADCELRWLTALVVEKK
jgi:hypothetical protein